MTVCELCGSADLDELSFGSNFRCNDCGEVVEGAESATDVFGSPLCSVEAASDEGEFWCYTCGDYRVCDDDGACTRCGESIDTD